MAVGIVQKQPRAQIDAYSLRITDEISLSLIQSAVGPSSSTSGAITEGSSTTPNLPIVHEATEIDTPVEDVEMESPVSPPFSPTIPARSLEPSSSMNPSPGYPTRYV
jgi:hypothetical protein